RAEGSPGEPGLRLRLSLVVRCGCVTHLASAVGTAVHGAVGFDPMAEDAASAMCTARRHLRYRTFEAVESSELLAAGERERAVVFVSARIADCHALPPSQVGGRAVTGDAGGASPCPVRRQCGCSPGSCGTSRRVRHRPALEHPGCRSRGSTHCSARLRWPKSGCSPCL